MVIHVGCQDEPAPRRISERSFDVTQETGLLAVFIALLTSLPCCSHRLATLFPQVQGSVLDQPQAPGRGQRPEQRSRTGE